MKTPLPDPSNYFAWLWSRGTMYLLSVRPRARTIKSDHKSRSKPSWLKINLCDFDDGLTHATNFLLTLKCLLCVPLQCAFANLESRSELEQRYFKIRSAIPAGSEIFHSTRSLNKKLKALKVYFLNIIHENRKLNLRCYLVLQMKDVECLIYNTTCNFNRVVIRIYIIQVVQSGPFLTNWSNGLIDHINKISVHKMSYLV